MTNSPSKDALIKIIGVGGAGGNTINRIYNHPFINVDLIAANTDNQALQKNKATYKLQLGAKLTKGLGAGGNPEIGRKAAEESIEEIKDMLRGANLVIITAGMGGGTGTGAAPLIAEVSKNLGVNLTIAVVTKPFSREGQYKMRLAEEAISKLKKYVDALIVIPNDRLLSLPPNTPAVSAYQEADNVLIETITGISDLITTPGDINVDFADIESIIKNSGTALVGIGRGKGPTRHLDAIRNALSFPLIENAEIKNAKGLIVYFRVPENFTIHEIQEALDYLLKRASKEEIRVKYGQRIDKELNDNEAIITLVAAGFGYEEDEERRSIDELFSVSKSITKPERNQGLNNETQLSYKPAFLRRSSSILD